MSDIADVLTTLVNIAEGVVYPNGPTQPSITGTDIVIYPGWPMSSDLDSALAAGKTHISVFPKPEERNTTRYREKYKVTRRPAPTLTLTVEQPGGGKVELEQGGNLLLDDAVRCFSKATA